MNNLKTHHSTLLFETLTQDIPINGNPLSLALFETAKQSILHLGDLEHTGDWDPYLIITLKNRRRIITPHGYPEITFGDFNEHDQSNFLFHPEEITTIIVEQELMGIDNHKPITIKVSDIDTIALVR